MIYNILVVVQVIFLWLFFKFRALWKSDSHNQLLKDHSTQKQSIKKQLH